MTKTLAQAFVLMFLSTFLVIVGDTGSKLLSDDGFSQLWVAWTRFAIASIILLPLSGVKIPEIRGLFDWRVILRAALICGAISSILTAIKTEPMANAFGGFFISPIVSYILSWLFLREKITWERSFLLGVSFIGVLVVVRPGFGMTTGMLFALLAGACHGTYLMTTRWLITDYRPRFLLISQLIIDSRKAKDFSAHLFIAIKGSRNDGHNFIKDLYKRGCRNFLISQANFNMSDCPEGNFLITPNSLYAFQDLARNHRLQFNLPVIGITGSNGKTIVKEWLNTCLEKAYNTCKSLT